MCTVLTTRRRGQTMNDGREPGKNYAFRPGRPVMIRRDPRSELTRQHDRANNAEIYEGLCSAARSEDVDRFSVAKEGFHRLSERDQQYLKSILHLSARLCLLLLEGNWTKAGVVLANLAPSTPDPGYSHEIADRLAHLEVDELEDRRMYAGIDQATATAA